MAIISKNPATLEVYGEYEEISDSVLESKISLASETYNMWKETSFEERKNLLLKLAKYLRENKDSLARLASIEMGKTLAAGVGEVEKCALCCEYYANGGEDMLKPEAVDIEGSTQYVRFDPIGVVLAVMPWNFPFWQVYRFIAPAVMAGNVGLLKHASNVPQCAEAIEKSFVEAGFPEGIFQNLFVGSQRVERIIRDPRVVAVTLTGSEKAGSSVASIAGSEIKKTVLELGGSDPFMVCKDADLKKAAEIAVKTRMQNNVGQSCIAAKRFIVHEDVVKEFEQIVVSEINKLAVGDPQDSSTTVGPLATEQGLIDVEEQVRKSIELGAVVLAGGSRGNMKGYYYLPTVLTNVSKGMPVYDEEVFGPVMPIITFKTEEEMINIANDTPYGLSATLFTNDKDIIDRVVPKIDSGSVFVNRQVASDPRAPFGGVKRSGYGRELSEYGIKEFVNVKYISIA